MKRASLIQQEFDQVGTIQDVTSVFETIASIHIAEIHDRVLTSTTFFGALWQVYRQLRRKGKSAASRRPKHTRPALLAITSGGGLIGDIDQRIVDAMLSHPERAGADVYMVGAHGATLLARRGVRPLQAFTLPQSESDPSLGALVQALNQYDQVVVYYQRYVSLLRQDVARIDLYSAVEQLSAQAGTAGSQIISSHDYIFEPSLDAVIAYMEKTMFAIALGQVLLESRLAQYASRFNAMSAAKIKARTTRMELRLLLNRTKRFKADERTKEVVSAMKALQRIR